MICSIENLITQKITQISFSKGGVYITLYAPDTLFFSHTSMEKVTDDGLIHKHVLRHGLQAPGKVKQSCHSFFHAPEMPIINRRKG